MSNDLYRYYDANGQLLYVGISLSAVSRAVAHRSTQGWWVDVATMTVERVEGSRADAMAAERAAIESERPLYNVTHNPSPVVHPAKTKRTDAKETEQEYASRVAAETRTAQGLPRYVDESVRAAAAAILAMAPVAR